ncbi:RHS repeat-associated core domain-containing protein [Chitinophaga sp. G-6-1-13]|uniref:RHS repeat-associated core domain-containing protein n=2 Tax=Chitinophaga fulva TaxID=2728842 RepID=A0A848GFD7_9BACT|nr:RHS repeat-associated core domain-containing protein [Chitinophaga fulva]
MNNAKANNSSFSYQFPPIADLTIAFHDKNVYKATRSVTLEAGFDTRETGETEIFVDPNIAGETTNITVSNLLPNISMAALTPLTFTFYDNYDFPGKHVSIDSLSTKLEAGNNLFPEPFTISQLTQSMVTGSKVRVLDTDQWLTTTTYYNDKGRTVQIISDNIAGGQDIATNMYDFNGKLLSNYLRHKNPRSGITPQTSILTKTDYNSIGLPVTVRKKVNDDASTEQTIASNEYDELGQLKTKLLGVKNNGDVVESLSHEYNIRGWIKSINKDYLNNNANTTSHFGQEFSYDEGFSNLQFNGNISGIRWKGWNDKKTRAYGYEYDSANRLIRANFTQQNNPADNWEKTVMNFSVDWINYDANGNIQNMKQYGMSGTSPVELDRLKYSYGHNSNKLLSIYDTTTVVEQLGDFKNGTNNGDDYDYDRNGNLTLDLNKSISAITYNYLNLPSQVQMGNKGTISYLYDAVGNKLQKKVVDLTGPSPTTTITDYIGGGIYQNDTLKLIHHEEGRIRFVHKAGQTSSHVFDYFVKDHLGNTRLVLTHSSDINTYVATMETATAATETKLFSNIEDTRANKPVGYPIADNKGKNEFVAKLNAKNGGKKIGPSLVLRVMAGDTVQIGAQAFYKSLGPDKQYPTELPAENMVASLLQAFGGTPLSTDNHGSNPLSQPTPFNSNFYNNEYRKLKEKNNDKSPTSRPKAYLNFVLFDDQFKLVETSSGVKRVKAEPDQLQTLTQDKMPISQSGFLYVYTSNESPQDVFFDNVTVIHSSGAVLEETHYYPFGLTMTGISTSTLRGTGYTENRLKYNGKELQNREFGDGSGLEWYDYGARMYDSQIGRFFSIDRDAVKYPKWSPYLYGANNPIRFIDLNGDGPGDVVVLLAGANIGGVTKGLGATPEIKATLEKHQKTQGTAIGTFSSKYWGTDIKTKRGFAKATDESYNFIKANYKEGGDVVLLGYSYGGNFINTLADRLKEDGIKVTLAVTIDAAAGGDNESVDRSISDNVETNLNIYQTTPEVLHLGPLSYKTGSHGGKNSAKNKNKTTVKNYNYSGYYVDNKDGEPEEVGHSNIHTVSLLHYITEILKIVDRVNDQDKKSN